MSTALNKTEVIVGVPLVFAPAGLDRTRVITVGVTGTGSVTINAKHMDNDSQEILASTGLPLDPVTIYGIGYREIEVIQSGVGTLQVSIAASRA